jgi:hypothetical protein
MNISKKNYSKFIVILLVIRIIFYLCYFIICTVCGNFPFPIHYSDWEEVMINNVLPKKGINSDVYFSQDDIDFYSELHEVYSSSNTFEEGFKKIMSDEYGSNWESRKLQEFYRSDPINGSKLLKIFKYFHLEALSDEYRE